MNCWCCMPLVLALAASEPAPATGPDSKARAPEPSAPAGPPPAPGRAAPEWLSAAGATGSEERASPEGALAWGDLLVAESSFAAASRAYENLVRCWPAAPQARGALLAAARAALVAKDYDRAERLAHELRSRWREPANALEQDQLVVQIGEARLGNALAGTLAPGESGTQARRALAAFSAVLANDQAGPWVERAALGRARAWLALGKTSRGIEALEEFLKDYPRSPLVPDARAELAATTSAKARGRSPERSVLKDARESAEWARQQAAGSPAGAASEAADAIAETYRAIAARQAELKMDEARLYLRLRQRRAAETVLRAILGRYGNTPSAQDAARLLEELARE